MKLPSRTHRRPLVTGEQQHASANFQTYHLKDAEVRGVQQKEFDLITGCNNGDAEYPKEGQCFIQG